MEHLNIKSVLVDRLLCDKCGTVMCSDGIVYTTYPPQYPYTCPECHHQQVSNKSHYPVYYLELSDRIMLELWMKNIML